METTTKTYTNVELLADDRVSVFVPTGDGDFVELEYNYEPDIVAEVVPEDEYDSGHTHKWMVQATEPWKLNYADQVYSVYEHAVNWGPEEGGYPYHFYGLRAVFLSRYDGYEVELKRARAEAEAFAQAEYGDDRDWYCIYRETVIGTNHSVGQQYYC